MNSYNSRVKDLKGEICGARYGRKPIHVPEEAFQRVELQIGVTLPLDYREFVRDYGNFGFFYGATYFVRPNSDGVDFGSLEYFFGIHTKQENDFDDVAMCYKSVCDNVDFWPREWMPIAVDGGGNNVALCIQGDNFGAVSFITTNMWTDNAQNVYLVADSFDEFMQAIFLRNN